MTNIDKSAETIEKLSLKIRALKFDFKDEELEQEADEAKEAAVAALEAWLDLASLAFHGNEPTEE